MRLFRRYYADIIVGLLQDVALQAALHPYAEPDASDLEVPPPMFGNNLQIATKCLRGNLLQQKVRESVVSSFSNHSCDCDVQYMFFLTTCPPINYAKFYLCDVTTSTEHIL